MNKMSYLIDGKRHTIPMPTRDDIRDGFDIFKTNKDSVLDFERDSGFINLGSAKSEERVELWFSNSHLYPYYSYARQEGILIDPQYLDSDQQIDVWDGEAFVPRSRHLTVSIELAIEVCIYYMENEKFPAHCMWEGKMDKFSSNE